MSLKRLREDDDDDHVQKKMRLSLVDKKRHREEEIFYPNKKAKLENVVSDFSEKDFLVQHIYELKKQNSELQDILKYKVQEVIFLQEQINQLYSRPNGFMGLVR